MVRAQYHLAHVFNKLGVRSRGELTVRISSLQQSRGNEAKR
jgi:hypothetical protein